MKTTYRFIPRIKVMSRSRQSTSVLCIIIDTGLTAEKCPSSKLKQIIDEWYQNEVENHLSFLDDRVGESFLDTINMKCILGTGSKTKSVHGKLMVTFVHRAKIRLDQSKIKKWYKGKISENVKLYCRYYGNEDESMTCLEQLDVETLNE